MDLIASSRAYFSHPSPTPSEKISLQASNTVYTYHCLCSHLLLATTTPLPSLPRRHHSADKAHIMPLPPAPTSSKTTSAPNDHYGLLISTRIEKAAEVISSDEGFEKRYLVRCARCTLVVGYQLDWAMFSQEKGGRREDYVFLLPGGLVTTSEMIQGKARRGDEMGAAGMESVGLTGVKA
jgi:hypothetical protein